MGTGSWPYGKTTEYWQSVDNYRNWPSLFLPWLLPNKNSKICSVNWYCFKTMRVISQNIKKLSPPTVSSNYMHRYMLRCIQNLIVPYCILFSSNLKFTTSLSKIPSDVAYLIMEFCHLTHLELKVSVDIRRKQHAEVNINFICRSHSWGGKSRWQVRAHWQNKNKEPAISQTKIFCSSWVRVLL